MASDHMPAFEVGGEPLHLPTLRERAENLSLLVKHSLRHFRRDLG